MILSDCGQCRLRNHRKADAAPSAGCWAENAGMDRSRSGRIRKAIAQGRYGGMVEYCAGQTRL